MTVGAVSGLTARRIEAADLARLLDASQVLDGARAGAATVLQAAQAEAAALLDAARQAIATERAEMEQQIRDRRTRVLEQTTAEAAALRVVQTTDAAAQLVARFDALTPWIGELVIATVARVVGAFDPDERMRLILDHAIASARRDWDLGLRCHPQSAPVLQALIDSDRAGPGRLQKVRGIVEDDTLAPGECLLESADGLIEIGLTAQIGQIRLALGLDGPGLSMSPLSPEPDGAA